MALLYDRQLLGGRVVSAMQSKCRGKGLVIIPKWVPRNTVICPAALQLATQGSSPEFLSHIFEGTFLKQLNANETHLPVTTTTAVMSSKGPACVPLMDMGP